MVNFIRRKMWRVEWKTKNKSVSDSFLIGSILLLKLVFFFVNFHATMCWLPLTAAGTVQQYLVYFLYFDSIVVN